MLFTMEYPHWIMVAGAVLVVFGFIGFAFRQKKSGPVKKPDRAQETKANGK
jgi:hypothetical protein